MHSNGQITAPVNTDDISSVLGENSHDVGTLCLSEKINRFNKHKPYRGTSPQIASRVTFSGSTADTAASNNNGGDNGIGCFCGNRGGAMGYPVYWGLKYPMNTAQQNYSGQGRSTLLELCFDVSEDDGQYHATRYHPNYEYARPVAGTDFFRMEDFIGYVQGAWTFLSAGVAGATPGDREPAEMTCNQFNDAYIRVYAMIPSDSVGWLLRDLVPYPQNYRLVAEFYKDDKVNVWKRGSTANPFLTKMSSASLFDAGLAISFDVPLSEIKQEGGFNDDNNDFSFYVCVGFNTYSGGLSSVGEAFVAPWNPEAQTCATLVSVLAGAPFVVNFSKYFSPTAQKAAPTSDGDYLAFPTAQTNVTSGDMYFKASIVNNGASALSILNTDSTQANTLIFRARAIGSFPNSDGQNTELVDDEYNGKAARLKVATNPDIGTNPGNIAVPNNGTAVTFYCKADGLIPHGDTTSIIIEASNDGGNNWTVCGSPYCRFRRN